MPETGSSLKEEFKELEYCIDKYFAYNLAPVMDAVRKDLEAKQSKELSEHLTPGLMMSPSLSPNPTPYATLRYVQATGEWNSKTPEDYVDMCMERMSSDDAVQKDLGLLVENWRYCAVRQLGEDRYEKISAQLGGDLALAYMDERIKQSMVDKLVKDKTPKDTAEYIIRKAWDSSLMGWLSNKWTPEDTDLGNHIKERAFEGYNPSKTEEYTAKAIGSVMDVATLGPKSWGRFALSVALDMGGREAAEQVEKWLSAEGEGQKEIAADEAVSIVLFSDPSQLKALRTEAKGYSPSSQGHTMAKAINDSLENKIIYDKFKPMSFESTTPSFFEGKIAQSAASSVNRAEEGIPSIIAPGKEEEYLQDKQEAARRQQEAGPSAQNLPAADSPQPSAAYTAQSVPSPQQEGQARQEQQDAPAANSEGWGPLMELFGLDGLKRTGIDNIGYSIAMLPDYLFGLFTGKDFGAGDPKNVKGLLSFFSIIMALKVRNPLLKMMMFGLGGLNLINRSGKAAEAMAKGETQAHSGTYRRYADEALDPRVTGVQLKGNLLIANIDRVPVSVTLPEKMVAAYNEGALPLNTMVNAVVRKHDQQQAMAQQNYTHAQEETIVRTRGIQ